MIFDNEPRRSFSRYTPSIPQKHDHQVWLSSGWSCFWECKERAYITIKIHQISELIFEIISFDDAIIRFPCNLDVIHRILCSITQAYLISPPLINYDTCCCSLGCTLITSNSKLCGSWLQRLLVQFLHPLFLHLASGMCVRVDADTHTILTLFRLITVIN